MPSAESNSENSWPIYSPPRSDRSIWIAQFGNWVLIKAKKFFKAAGASSLCFKKYIQRYREKSHINEIQYFNLRMESSIGPATSEWIRTRSDVALGITVLSLLIGFLTIFASVHASQFASGWPLRLGGTPVTNSLLACKRCGSVCPRRLCHKASLSTATARKILMTV